MNHHFQVLELLSNQMADEDDLFDVFTEGNRPQLESKDLVEHEDGPANDSIRAKVQQFGRYSTDSSSMQLEIYNINCNRDVEGWPCLDYEVWYD